MNENTIPTQIGKYKIEGLITHGGMSLLYIGSQADTQMPVIIKVLLPKYLSDRDVVDRFLNEARIIALANHPNIVRLLDSGKWEGGLYIAMEFVKGTSLRKVFQHQPYSLKRAMDVLLQIAYALSHLHSHGIVHGDLKPENILINEHGEVKVIDFGIAQVLSETKPDSPQRFLGTPIYMSPELGLDRHSLSFQSDIYALGIIAYELAIGKLSHGRIILSLAPVGLQKILSKALQPRPSDRYSDMCDMITDLTAYIRSGAFEKDKQGSDYFLEIFEQLEHVQSTLLPQEPPAWKGLQVDFAHVQEIGLSNLYVDFIELDGEKKLIFAAVSNKKGAEGIIDSCKLQATLRTKVSSRKEKPLETLQSLHEHIEKDIAFAYLLLDTASKMPTFYQNNYGYLFQINDEGLLFVGTKQKPEINLSEVTSQTNAEALLRKICTHLEEPTACVIKISFIPN